jgi:hypothetical protein
MNDRDPERAEAIHQIAAVLAAAYLRLRFPHEFSAGVSDVAEYHALRAVQQRTADERHKAYMDFVDHKKAHQG